VTSETHVCHLDFVLAEFVDREAVHQQEPVALGEHRIPSGYARLEQRQREGLGRQEFSDRAVVRALHGATRRVEDLVALLGRQSVVPRRIVDDVSVLPRSRNHDLI
jgi:hypothetical protein